MDRSTLTMKMLYHSINALIYATVSMKMVVISLVFTLAFAPNMITFMFFLRRYYEIVNARRNVYDIHWLTEFMLNNGIFFTFFVVVILNSGWTEQ